ncbi:MAG: hypothetical protein U0744_19825 [Gemmataceae bacterium]
MFRRCAVLLSLLWIGGCESRGDLFGKVMLGDKTVKMATVTVWPKDKVPRPVVLDAEGGFAVRDIPTGEAVITVVSPNPKVEAAKIYVRELPKGTPPPPNATPQNAPAPAASKDWFPIPAKYGDLKTSDLKLVIESGKNVKTLTLSN